MLNQLEHEKQKKIEKRRIYQRKLQLYDELQAQVSANAQRRRKFEIVEKKFGDEIYKNVEAFKQETKAKARQRRLDYEQEKLEAAEALRLKRERKRRTAEREERIDQAMMARAKANLEEDRQLKLQRKAQKQVELEKVRIMNEKVLKRKADERRAQIEYDAKLNRQYIEMMKTQDARRAAAAAKREADQLARVRVGKIAIDQNNAKDEEMERKNREAQEARYRAEDEKARAKAREARRQRKEIQRSIIGQVQRRQEKQEKELKIAAEFARKYKIDGIKAIREAEMEAIARKQRNFQHRKVIEAQIQETVA